MKFLENSSFLPRKVVFFLVPREEFKTEENPKYSRDAFLNCNYSNATQMLLAAFDGFTGLVEKLSKEYEDPVVETSRG